MTSHEALKALSPREKHFAMAYAKNPNGKQAAIEAGYAPKSAEVTASRVLSRAKVQAALQALTDELVENTKITAAGILTDIHKIAKQPALTTSMYMVKLRAFELLGKHLQMFKEDKTKEDDEEVRIWFDYSTPRPPQPERAATANNPEHPEGQTK